MNDEALAVLGGASDARLVSLPPNGSWRPTPREWSDHCPGSDDQTRMTMFHVEHDPEGMPMESMGDLSEEQMALLRHFATLLRGSPHNLLSQRGLTELEERHFPEGVAFARIVPPSERVLDVGSGGGLPGIIVAIMRPDVSVHLLEATAKKAAFLTDAVAALGIPAIVHHGRAEELGDSELRATFDVVTARAVAPLDRLAPLCAPFLRPGGKLYAIKGERWREELDAAGTVLDRLGMAVLETPDSGLQEDRSAGMPLVVVLERTRSRDAGPGTEASDPNGSKLGYINK
jgi:16S rRNA (guanine527-N7)-methyltransferase